jgi:hypothetical protein
MKGRIRRSTTAIAAMTFAALLVAPATSALAKSAPAGTGAAAKGKAAAAAPSASKGTGGSGSGTQEGSGTSGNKGSANKGGTTKKGTTLGDLNMVLRYASGVPMVDGNGCVQPITTVAAPGLDLAEAQGMYQYDVPVYLIPLLGAADPTAPCDVQAAYATAVVPVDFGRLSVGRSPESVLAKQLADVTTLMTTGGAVLALDASGRIVVNGAAIDSPLQSLAIYQQLLEKGNVAGVASIGDLNSKQLAAAAFAAAADKTAAQTIDTVQFMNRILKIPTDTTVLGTLPGPAGEKFVDYTGFNYNRATMFPGYITYWDLTGTTPVLIEKKSIIDAVFASNAGAAYTGAKAFASMVDDARQVLLFVHDQVEVKVDPIGTSS